MSERGEAQAKKDTHVSGAKPKPEGRVRERGWRPTRKVFELAAACKEARRPRAIAAADKMPLGDGTILRRPRLAADR